MDPLSDVLRVVRLSGAYFYTVEASAPWSIEALPARDLTPRVMPDAEHLVSYHILTEGSGWAGLLGETPVLLQPGDVIVFPHGDAHLLSSAPGRRFSEATQTAVPARHRNTVVIGADGKPDATFVCGFLGCDRRPFNPVIAALPRQLHMRGAVGEGGWLSVFPRQVVSESRTSRVGSDTMLTRMAELMFIEVLRRYLEALPAEQTGWLAGLRDPMITRALALLHEQPQRAWTLADMAREVASSRSVFAQRFTELVGQPPMQYLTHWRMQVASDLLMRSDAKVSAIASQVGYESEAAFSRAFKKATDSAPTEWRLRRSAQRQRSVGEAER